MEQRYAAMEQIAKAGILTGISMMPILPGLCDTDENLEATIRCTANHGGRFVIAGGLTLADRQRDYFFDVLRDRFPDLLPLYERMYPHPSTTYGGIRTGDPHVIGRRIRDLCRQYGISDRMPRPIIPGDKRALNKRIVEALANQCYWLELDNAPSQRVWAYRKAAWAIEDLDVDVGLLYRQMGPLREGLESVENVGPRLAAVFRMCSPSWRLIQRAANGQAAAVENTFASLSAGVRVDHRRLDVLVAQQFLDSGYVIVVLQEVRGEAVAQGVGPTGLTMPARCAAWRTAFCSPLSSRWWRTAPLRGSTDSRSEGKTRSACQPHSRFALGYLRSSASGK